MIAAYLYQYIYLFIVTVITITAIKTKRLPTEREKILPATFLCFIMILFIGFRPISGVYFLDMANYAQYWGVITHWEGFDFFAQNLLFDNLFNFLASGLEVDITVFFVLIATIYFIGILAACKKLFPNHILLSYLVCLAAFSTFSYATNGVKAGAAASLFLVALAYRDKIGVSILFLFLSWGFHHSMQLPVAAYVLTLFFKKKKWYFYGWIFCLLMAIAHITSFQQLFAGFTDDSGASYLSSNSATGWSGKSGFRIDFVIYSAMPVLIGYYVKFKYKLEDKLYDIMLNLYLTTNGMWMLCMYVASNNRIAYLSWFMYPILLVYPCFTIDDKYHPLVKNRNKIIGYHLAFTLFMILIYYA